MSLIILADLVCSIYLYPVKCSCKITWKLKTYLYYHNAYWPLSKFPPQSQRSLESRGRVWDLKKNQKHNISTTTVPMVTRFERVVTYIEKIPPIESHDPLNTWFDEVTWKITYIIHYISAFTKSRVTKKYDKFTYHDKLVWDVTYCKGL